MIAESADSEALPTPTSAAVITATFVFVCWILVTIVDSQVAVSRNIFVRRDVAAVYFLSAIPLAATLATLLTNRGSSVRMMIVVSLWSADSLLLIEQSSFESKPWLSSDVAINLVRAFTATGVAIAFVTLTTVLLNNTKFRTGPCRRISIFQIAVGILMATILPAVYVQARCRHDVAKTVEFLEQSRFGEALIPLRDLVRMSPSMQWKGHSLKKVSQEIERQVQELEIQVAIPLTEHDDAELRLQRCRQLAMLGRTREALVLLTSLLDSSVSTSACELSGLIHETTAQWETARLFHKRAKEEWLNRTTSSESHPRILRATTRLAYCERKLGNYERAEQEYCEAVARSPTGDTHFLVAQFYEDMQQSTKAYSHARRAMALDPQRYHREGTKLIDKLMVGHFGCLNIVSAEMNAGQPLAPVQKTFRTLENETGSP